MLGKQRDIFLADKQRQGIDRGFQIQKPALFRLGDPFFRIVVAVEDDALMLPDNPLNEGFQRSLKIRGSFQLVGKLRQRFRNNGIENQVGAGDGEGRNQHAELEFIAGKGEGRGPVPVGGVLAEMG